MIVFAVFKVIVYQNISNPLRQTNSQSSSIIIKYENSESVEWYGFGQISRISL